MWEYSPPLISPELRDHDRSRAQKDPSVVRFRGRWHVFMTVKLPGRSAIEYCSFEDWKDANRARRTLGDWIPHRICAEYALTPDWDDRWRTGGSVDEIVDEAHLSPRWLLQGIERFVRERDTRLKRLRESLDAAEGHKNTEDHQQETNEQPLDAPHLAESTPIRNQNKTS